MTLRVKSSSESVFTNYQNPNSWGEIGRGDNGNWNLNTEIATSSNTYTRVNNKWATLVQYEYECDIIGPKSMLDLTLEIHILLILPVSVSIPVIILLL